MDCDGIRVRKGVLADAGLLAEMGAATFYDSYVDQIEARVLADFVAEVFGLEKQAAELADPASCFLLAEREGQAVGYARLLWDETPEAVGGKQPPERQRALELQRIYARKAWIGRGVGAALMRACLDEARVQGCEMMWLGVWERNARAIRFYEKWGFEVVGEQAFHMGEEVQRDLLMRAHLSLTHN